MLFKVKSGVFFPSGNGEAHLGIEVGARNPAKFEFFKINKSS